MVVWSVVEVGGSHALLCLPQDDLERGEEGELVREEEKERPKMVSAARRREKEAEEKRRQMKRFQAALSDPLYERRKLAEEEQMRMARRLPRKIPDTKEDPVSVLEWAKKGWSDGGTVAPLFQQNRLPRKEEGMQKDPNKRRLFSEPRVRDRGVSDQDKLARKQQEVMEKLASHRAVQADSHQIKVFQSQGERDQLGLRGRGRRTAAVAADKNGLPQPRSFEVNLGDFDPEAYLAPQRMKEGEDSMKRFQFNQLRSEETPYDRELKDVRNPRQGEGEGEGKGEVKGEERR